MLGYIYKITSPTQKVYIGQTLNVDKRLGQYSRLDCKGQVRLYRSIKKYGWAAHKFEVICECASENLNDKERYYQELYRVLENGLNCKLTNTTTKSGQLSEETKRRIGVGNKGKKRSEEAKRNVSIGKLGKSKTKEHKQKISDSLRGRPLSAERVSNIIKSRKYGPEHPMYGKKRPELSERNRKPCIIDGHYYPSLKDAAVALNISKDRLRNRLRSKKYDNYNYC